MYLYIFIGFLVLASLSCQSQKAQIANNSAENKVDSISNSLVNSNVSENNKNVRELIQTFTDDKNVGVPRKNKIELSEFAVARDNVVQIKFYSLDKNKTWQLKQNFELVKYGGLSCNMKISDFDNDGFKDVNFVSGIAARGANEVRNLLIYDKSKNELVFIKNSGDFPNLRYNKTLNCIDSQGITGSSWTSFLKIDGDELKEFARVETSNTDNSRYVYLIDKDGKEKLLRKDKISADELYDRYKTFNPPRINTDEEN